ncbi:MAG: acyltransferase [Pseudomonadales bacterium]|nr:acyltransferase [Pseudomonadales bacterium]
MIRDHRPYYIKHWFHLLEGWFTRHFIEPQLTGLGTGYHFMKPWNVRVHGNNISLGKNAHIVTARDRTVSLSTWEFNDHQGHIEIHDNCLLCPGVRLDSASKIVIEDNCMLAAGSYVTDADWHDIYDRTRIVGATAPVTLKENVWLGDGATVCKGVTIGRNSVIGAGAVVVNDIPDNAIAVGNPAKVVKSLDPERELVTRAQLFRDPVALAEFNETLDRSLLKENSTLGWLRALFFPRRGD